VEGEIYMEGSVRVAGSARQSVCAKSLVGSNCGDVAVKVTTQ
jgi:hypothetical protein